MDLASEQRAYKVDHNISEALRSMAEQIGFLKLSAHEVIEIHSATIKKISKEPLLRRLKPMPKRGG